MADKESLKYFSRQGKNLHQARKIYEGIKHVQC